MKNRYWGRYRPPDVVLVLGVPGSGKTTEAKRLTESAQRVVYLDPVGDYRDVADQVTASQLAEDPALLAPDQLRIAVLVEGDTDQDRADQVEATISLCRDAGEMVLVLDEVGDYRQRLEVLLGRLARQGRHAKIVSLWVSQFMTDIPKTVRRAATEVRCFGQTNVDDLEALSEQYGERFRDKVAKWQKTECPALWRVHKRTKHKRGENGQPEKVLALDEGESGETGVGSAGPDDSGGPVPGLSGRKDRQQVGNASEVVEQGE